MPVKIFFCYAREDEPLLNKLKTHLRPLQREGLIEVWYDRDINAGTEWETEIKQHLNTADIILLLVSPDFMDSDYCYGIEMKRALERRARGEAEVIPVILRHVYWHGEPLGRLQALPKDGKPATDPDWHNLDRAFYDVATGIRVVVEKLISLHPALMIKPFPVEKLALLRTLTDHRQVVSGLAISPNGQTLVSGSWDCTIKIWNLPTSKELYTLANPTGGIWRVAISPDGQTLVSANADKTIRVWNLPTGKELRILSGHASDVISVAISPNGQTLVSGSSDTTIRVWNLPTGKELRILSGHASDVNGVAISPDGQTLVSGSGD